MKRSGIGVIAVVVLTSLSADATPMPMPTPTATTTAQAVGVTRPALLTRPTLNKAMTMKQAIAASRPFALPMPPPPSTPPKAGTQLTSTGTCPGGGARKVTYSMWSAVSDPTTGLNNETVTLTFSACQIGTSTYDGSITFAQSSTATSTNTGNTASTSATVIWSYDGGPLKVTGEKPVVVTFRHMVYTAKLDLTATTAGTVTSSSIKETTTMNGSMTVDGQSFTFNNDTASVDAVF